MGVVVYRVNGVAAWNVLILLVLSHSNGLSTTEGLRAMGVLCRLSFGEMMGTLSR